MDKGNKAADRNVRLYPWYQFFNHLIFWQAVWFLYFQSELSAAEAILLYAVYDIGTMVMEVPSGYMSDRLGRRITLIASVLAGAGGMVLLAMGGGFWVFALGQVLFGASIAFGSGTDSAFLFESLATSDRAEEVEAHELHAWRYSFAALAISAVIGGVMALTSFEWVFWLSALAFVIATILVLNFVEPGRVSGKSIMPLPSELARLMSLKSYLTHPTLLWLFGLSVLMYCFSHIPFVFGQPFIEQVLSPFGWATEAPLISGGVTALMMILSVVVSLGALGLRRAIGLPAVLLMAFGLQVAIIAVLSQITSIAVIAILLLRMVPNSLSRPFILASIHPLLVDNIRATYLSLQSFLGRIFFSASLFVAASGSSETAGMTMPEIQTVLGWYTLIGLVCFIALSVTVTSSLKSET